LDLGKLKKETPPKEIRDLVKKREEARKKKDWEKSDKLREQINKKGYLIEDSQDEVKIKKK